MRLLLSIRPEHANSILNGEKKFEYRRRVFKREVTSVVLYASSPMRKLVGEIQIGEILCKHPHDLWRATSKEGGVTSKQFFEYFDGCETGYALSIGTVTKYDEPLEPSDVVEGFRPPQSFSYIA